MASLARLLQCMRTHHIAGLLIILAASCGPAPEENATVTETVSTPVLRTAVRVGTFNVQALGTTRSEQFLAVQAIVSRVDADVICLQEVEDDEYWRLRSLARKTGYDHFFMGGISSAMAGGLANACLSRFAITEAYSLTSPDLSRDEDALEVGRDIVVVRVEPRPGVSMLVVDLHLKSGFKDADRFRRQVEIYRTLQAVERHPADVTVVLGDFNEEIDGATLGRTFTWFPSDLPRSFHLGWDIRFPVVYDPFASLAQAGFALSDPTQEDSSWKDGTRIPSSKRIDFVLFRGAELAGDEVYDACTDDGYDAWPRGDRLEKAGSPLPCGINLTGSDHRPVIVDLDFTRVGG